MSPFDIAKFIEKIKDMDYAQILVEAQQEVYRAESGTSGIKGAVKKREAGALEYAAEVKGLIFFLSSGIKPAGVSNHIFYSFKPIVQNLVNKKQFKPDALEVFKDEK
jgi:hypothetical protein